MIVVTTLMMMLAKTADQKPLMKRPVPKRLLESQAANLSMNALITTVNNPSVSTISGNERNFKTVPIVAFTNPNTAATTRRVHHMLCPSYTPMPGTTHTAKATASAIDSHLTRNFMKPLFRSCVPFSQSYLLV
jgi:hypothetical protein